MSSLTSTLKDPRILKATVNKFITISELTDAQEYGAIYCEFHGEKRSKGSHPSAKFFCNDEDDIEKIYCWVCRRQWTAYDYIKRVKKSSPLGYLLQKVNHQLIKDFIDGYEVDTTREDEKNDKLDNIISSSKSIQEIINRISLGT
jgi:hypothetical protein